MSSLAFLAGGEAILPAVTQAVELARERGIFVVWVGLSHLAVLVTVWTDYAAARFLLVLLHFLDVLRRYHIL